MSETVINGQQESSVDYSQLGSFLKYCSDDDCVIKGIFEDHRIRFTPPSELNDPLEANPILRFKDRRAYRWFHYDGMSLPSQEWWFRLHLIQRRINKFGILSLTKVWDSFDMWSRYANGHKGFLLWLKGDFNEQPCMLSREGKPYPVIEVEYPPLHTIAMGEVLDAKGRFRREAVHERLFFQKVSRWHAEHEYRMVRPLSDLLDGASADKKPDGDPLSGLFGFSLDCVEGVTFGACMSVEKRNWIKRLCNCSRIPCSQAYVVRDEKEEQALGGKMGKVKMAPADLSARLMDVNPCILDSAYIDDQTSKSEIASLSELPYWNDDPAWVQELYDNRKRRQRSTS